MKDVLFYQNYAAPGDVCTIAVCIICWLFLASTYTIKHKNLLIFHLGNLFVCISAMSSIAYHTLIDRMNTGNIIWIYFFRNATYIFLISTFVLYVIYIENLLNLQDKAKRMVYLFNWLGISVYIVLQLSTPVSKLGFYIDENLQIHENYYFDVFRFFYIYYMLFLCGLLYTNKKKMVTKMYQCMRNVMLVSFGVMTIQSFYEATSVVSITFSFPILASLFLFHYNAYDSETGTLDSKAFHAYIKDFKNNKFSMICLYLKDSNAEKNHDFAVELFHFSEKYFKSSCTFKLHDSKMVLVYEDEKNKDADIHILTILKGIKALLEEFKIDYRIVFIKSDISIHNAEEYLSLNEFIEGQMLLNTVYSCEEKDIIAFGKASNILNTLKDMNEKGDLADERVLVYCQPVLDSQTNTFTTAEALMRLKLPDVGIVFPNQFIPMAEKHEYIHTLSKIILDKVCKEIKQLEKKGYYLERVSINFSVQELRDKNFSKEVIEIIQKNEVDYQKIAIELTESKNEKDFENMKTVMSELHSLGIKFYLDDFGTGYSNLERIIGLPIDIIKFDRSLTLFAGKNDESRYLVGSFSDIFKKANYQILFEGIENEEEEKICKEMQASYLQGFKYSRPVPMERLTEFLTKKSS